MNLRLDLSRHCIETEVRKQYNRAVSHYFQKIGDSGRFEATIELTRCCLERLDFSALRRCYPQLAGHATADVVVTMDGDDIRIAVDGRPIAIIMRQKA